MLVSALYSTASPKLPYEIGQLPPLKPNCCPLSELVKPRPEKPGPSRCYGTRGMNGQKVRKRAAFHYPRKSPREHASTRAGSVGLRRLADDARSTASEDAVSETHSSLKAPTENQRASERLEQFLSEVFSEASELDACDAAEGEAVTPSSNQPDVSSLFSECDARDLIRNEIQTAKPRRGRFKRKKNRTGWPNKKKKGSRTNSSESDLKAESVESAERTPGDETAQETLSEAETDASGTEPEHSATDKCKSDEAPDGDDNAPTVGTAPESGDADSSDKLLIDLKVVVDDKPDPEKERKPRSSGSEEERELRKKRRALAGLCDWLPVVRVARVEPAATRRLRSAARPPAARRR